MTSVRPSGAVQTPTNVQQQSPLPALSRAQIQGLAVALRRGQTPEQLLQTAQRMNISPENLARYLNDPTTRNRLPQDVRSKAAQLGAAMVRAQQQEELQQQQRSPRSNDQNRDNPAQNQQPQGNPVEAIFNLFTLGLYGLIKGAITGAPNQEQRRAQPPGADNRATPQGQ